MTAFVIAAICAGAQAKAARRMNIATVLSMIFAGRQMRLALAALSPKPAREIIGQFAAVTAKPTPMNARPIQMALAPPRKAPANNL